MAVLKQKSEPGQETFISCFFFSRFRVFFISVDVQKPYDLTTFSNSFIICSVASLLKLDGKPWLLLDMVEVLQHDLLRDIRWCSILTASFIMMQAAFSGW